MARTKISTKSFAMRYLAGMAIAVAITMLSTNFVHAQTPLAQAGSFEYHEVRSEPAPVVLQDHEVNSNHLVTVTRCLSVPPIGQMCSSKEVDSKDEGDALGNVRPLAHFDDTPDTTKEVK